MSKYDAELRRRLQSGEPIAETRTWFMECIVKDEHYSSDLTPDEVMFLTKTTTAYENWLLNCPLRLEAVTAYENWPGVFRTAKTN